MIKEKTKKKSHGKPSISQSEYKKTMDELGIEGSYIKKSKPVMVYCIYCQHKKVLDQSKFAWSRRKKYADDKYSNWQITDDVCKDLEKKYKDWVFSPVSEFHQKEDINIINKSILPKSLLIDLKSESESVVNHMKKDNKTRTESHQNKIMVENGIEEENKPKTKRKNKKK